MENRDEDIEGNCLWADGKSEEAYGGRSHKTQNYGYGNY